MSIWCIQSFSFQQIMKNDNKIAPPLAVCRNKTCRQHWKAAKASLYAQPGLGLTEISEFPVIVVHLSTEYCGQCESVNQPSVVEVDEPGERQDQTSLETTNVHSSQRRVRVRAMVRVMVCDVRLSLSIGHTTSTPFMAVQHDTEDLTVAFPIKLTSPRVLLVVLIVLVVVLTHAVGTGYQVQEAFLVQGFHVVFLTKQESPVISALSREPVVLTLVLPPIHPKLVEEWLEKNDLITCGVRHTTNL